MAVIATVAVRPLARRLAAAPPARSICDSNQPPKMSPCGLASAGIAMARSAGSVLGGRSGVSEEGMANPNLEASGYPVQVHTVGSSLRPASSFAGIANRSCLLRYRIYRAAAAPPERVWEDHACPATFSPPARGRS